MNIVINLPEDVLEVLKSKAKLERMSRKAYIEKLLIDYSAAPKNEIPIRSVDSEKGKKLTELITDAAKGTFPKKEVSELKTFEDLPNTENAAKIFGLKLEMSKLGKDWIANRRRKEIEDEIKSLEIGQ